MYDSQNDDVRKLGGKLQQLVSMLGLKSGHVSMNVHQGAIPVVQVKQCEWIVIGSASSDQRPDEEEANATTDAENFVRDKLGPLVVEALGSYGEVVAEVKAGNIAGFRLVRKCRNDYGWYQAGPQALGAGLLNPPT